MIDHLSPPCLILIFIWEERLRKGGTHPRMTIEILRLSSLRDYTIDKNVSPRKSFQKDKGAYIFDSVDDGWSKVSLACVWGG